MSSTHEPLAAAEGLSATRALARFAARLTFDDLPADVVHKAKLCVADTIACVCAGYGVALARGAVDLVKEGDSRPQATLWLDGTRAAAHEVAMANAIVGHVTLQEDMHVQTYSHPGSIIVPAALAVAEQIGASGRQALLAIVLGYEGMLRIGLAMHTRAYEQRGFRPSGFFGPFGAALAAGYLMELSEDQVVAALGLAGNTIAGMREWGNAGTSDVFCHNGFAARNGIVCAQLAARGFTGPERILEGAAGLYAGYSDGPSLAHRATDRLGEHFHIRDVYFKPVPACSAVQTASQLALALARTHDLDPAQVMEVVVGTHEHGKHTPGCDYAGPFATIEQAGMSNQFAVATALVLRGNSYHEYTRFADARIAAVARRVRVEIDPEVHGVYPAQKASRITIRLRDGRRIDGFQEDMRYPGEPEIREKLASLGHAVLGPAATSTVADMTFGLEQLADVRDLTGRLLATAPVAQA